MKQNKEWRGLNILVLNMDISIHCHLWQHEDATNKIFKDLSLRLHATKVPYPSWVCPATNATKDYIVCDQLDRHG